MCAQSVRAPVRLFVLGSLGSVWIIVGYNLFRLQSVRCTRLRASLRNRNLEIERYGSH